MRNSLIEFRFIIHMSIKRQVLIVTHMFLTFEFTMSLKDQTPPENALEKQSS